MEFEEALASSRKGNSSLRPGGHQRPKFLLKTRQNSLGQVVAFSSAADSHKAR